MKPFDVYPLFNIAPVRGEGIYLYDKNGKQYMDMYGGHAVISIGHSHPVYVNAITEQLQNIGFYSNSVMIPQQQILAEKLGRISGYPDYSLFLCNSGAEANENAFKLASFKNGKKKIIAFHQSFHGRTSLAVAATDDKKLQAPVNQNSDIIFLPLNDTEALAAAFTNDIGAVVVEGIQGVGGVQIPTASFLQKMEDLCKMHHAVLILDEVQSGYGRSGRFFAHQYAGIKPDLITIAKGMGNGFPVAGVLISPAFEPKHGMLGTTFGGSYLACTAATAVLDVIESENLIEHTAAMGSYFMDKLKSFDEVKEVRGMGLMIGVELFSHAALLRNLLLTNHNIFTGSSSDKNTLRILPPLNITKKEVDTFLTAFAQSLKTVYPNHEAVSLG